MKKSKILTIVPLGILLDCYVTFMLLSWILLFRDIRALKGFGILFDATQPLLMGREYLLHHGLNSFITVFFLITGGIAFFFYLVSLFQKISLRKTIIFAVLFQLITFFSYPILSTDIFSYMFSERVSTAHQQNIWKVIPATFSQDQFGMFADWKETTSIYGAVHFILYYPVTLLGKDNIIGTVILYKIVPLIFLWATMWVVYRLLVLQKSKEISMYMRLVFWNPLLILEIAGSGHNDIIMIFFMLAGYVLFQKKSYAFAGILFALAVQVKLIPIVLFIYCCSMLFSQKKFMQLVSFFALFLVVHIGAFSFMQITPFAFLERVAFNNTVYWQSFAQILSEYRIPGGGFLIGVVLIAGIVLSWKIFKGKLDPMSAYAITILIYLLFVTGAYWNWYVLWVLAVVPFIKNKKLQVVILLFSLTSFLAYPVLWIIQRINKPSPLWVIVQYLLLVLPMALGFLYNKKKIDSYIAVVKGSDV